jgi:hypothetical protein
VYEKARDAGRPFDAILMDNQVGICYYSCSMCVCVYMYVPFDAILMDNQERYLLLLTTHPYYIVIPLYTTVTFVHYTPTPTYHYHPHPHTTIPLYHYTTMHYYYLLL